ncbi:MAG TPA: cobalamin-independent methionine synthase II family protein [Xanthobacteraceae bacterium]
MKTSDQRILTTHVGSLPRTEAVVRLLDAREGRAAHDAAEFDRTIRRAVLDIVKRQAEIGVDIVSDGETSKISYATYVHDRLAGFSEEGTPGPLKPHLDVAAFPEFRKRMAQFTGAQRFKRVTCVGPIKVQNREALARDLDNMRAAVDVARPAEGFLNAASPGVVASFLPNSFYPSHEAYIEAIADAMQEEYAAVAAAGFILQLDCPDLAMSRHTGFQDLSETEFLKRAAFHVEALNHALAKVPANMVRMHVCWGNYEGPHTYDIDFRKIVRIVLGANVQGIALEAANPRHAHEWAVWKEVKLPEDKVLLPGVIDTSTNYVEHPELVAERIIRFAEIVGRERVIANTDCGFGTAAGSGKLDPEIAFLKLGALVAGAKEASDRLWGRA